MSTRVRSWTRRAFSIMLVALLPGCFNSKKPLITETDAVTPLPARFSFVEINNDGTIKLRDANTSPKVAQIRTVERSGYQYVAPSFMRPNALTFADLDHSGTTFLIQSVGGMFDGEGASYGIARFTGNRVAIYSFPDLDSAPEGAEHTTGGDVFLDLPHLLEAARKLEQKALQRQPELYRIGSTPDEIAQMQDDVIVAIKNLARHYALGLGVARDDAAAVGLLSKAATAGDLEAMNDLALMIRAGQGTKQDIPNAIAWFRQSAAAGSVGAMLNLGETLRTDEFGAKDLVEAKSWYTNASLLGSLEAMAKLGELTEGDDYKNAIALYARAAQGGNPAGMYLYGRTMLQSRNGDGIAWIRKAADAGDSLAMYRLAFAYERGEFVPQNDVQAVEWYGRSAQAGDRDAMLVFAQRLMAGKGIAKDETEAARWFGRSAAAGNANAMASYGYMLEHGQGQPRDHQAALYWLHQSATLGNQTGKQFLAEVEPRTTQSDENLSGERLFVAGIAALAAIGIVSALSNTPATTSSHEDATRRDQEALDQQMRNYQHWSTCNWSMTGDKYTYYRNGC